MADNAKINAAIARAAASTGVPAPTLDRFVQIESGGNPNNVTGSYKGALQLSDQEFAKHGGSGSIFDVDQNIMAGARKIAAERARFEARNGRAPDDHELYLIHQQGEGGSDAHLRNPDGLAWQNMAATAEGRQKGEAWAKQAIWGNVPDDRKAQYGSVDQMTSRQFADLWASKISGVSAKPRQEAAGAEMQPAGTQVASAAIGAPAAPVEPVASMAIDGAVRPPPTDAGGSPDRGFMATPWKDDGASILTEIQPPQLPRLSIAQLRLIGRMA